MTENHHPALTNSRKHIMLAKVRLVVPGLNLDKKKSNIFSFLSFPSHLPVCNKRRFTQEAGPSGKCHQICRGGESSGLGLGQTCL